MRFNFNTTATQKRLATYSGNKSSYATVFGVSIRGFFNAISSTPSTQAMGISGQAYEFTTEGQKDIKINDILTINSEDYHVRGVQRNTLGAIDQLKVTMDKPEKTT